MKLYWIDKIAVKNYIEKGSITCEITRFWGDEKKQWLENMK